MKFLSPYDAYEAFISETYEGVEDMCEPDSSLPLKTIVDYTFAGIQTGINVYDDYDDSEEGASYPLDYDYFDGMQDVIDMNNRLNNPVQDVISDKTTNEVPSPGPAPES